MCSFLIGCRQFFATAECNVLKWRRKFGNVLVQSIVFRNAKRYELGLKDSFWALWDFFSEKNWIFLPGFTDNYYGVGQNKKPADSLLRLQMFSKNDVGTSMIWCYVKRLNKTFKKWIIVYKKAKKHLSSLEPNFALEECGFHLLDVFVSN